MIQQIHIHSGGYVTGFFYGNLASVLLPLLPAALFSRWKGMPSAVGKLLIIGLMAITASNAFYFTVGNNFNHGKYTSDLYQGKFPGHNYPIDLQNAFPGLKFISEDRPYTLWPQYKEQETRDVLYSHWRSWKDGRPMDFSKIGPWNVENLWFLAEMYYLQGNPSLRGNFGYPAVEGTMIFKARARAKAAGIALPPQSQIEADALALGKTEAQFKAEVQAEVRAKNIAEFEKWRESVPDYEKRLYDRVKQMNMRVVRLTKILIGGLVIVILIFVTGFVLIFKRLKKGDHPKSVRLSDDAVVK